MLGWVLLSVFLGFLIGAAGVVGFLELGYRIGRRRRVERQLDSHLNGFDDRGAGIDSRERRRLVDDELRRLRR